MKVDGHKAGEDLGRQDGTRAAPAVTVLMSVYNGRRFVAEAIESVLRQTWTDFEFLIVNDGSADGTPEVINSFRDSRIRLLNNPVNVGLTKSLNRGLAAARGALVARQDADDISHPERLAAQVGFMRSNPDVALVGTQVRVLDERGRVSRPPGWERASGGAAIRFQLMFDNAFVHTSVLFRREVVWGRLGGYDESFVTGQDFDLWSRVAARYEVRNLARRLVDYRFHAGSAAARYGGEHLGLSRAVVAANLRRHLKLTHVPDEWPRLISALHVNRAPGTEPELSGLVAAAEAIFERFMKCHPEERSNPEIRKVLAGKMGQVACRLAGSRRRAALGAFGRACRLNVRSAGSSASRFFALLLFGERLRTRLRPGTGHGRPVV